MTFQITQKLLKEIKKATLSEKMEWYNVEGDLCSEGRYKNDLYFICKYPIKNSRQFEVSFNKINEYGNIIKPFKEFHEGQTFFKEILELADIVWERKLDMA